VGSEPERRLLWGTLRALALALFRSLAHVRTVGLFYFLVSFSPAFVFLWFCRYKLELERQLADRGSALEACRGRAAGLEREVYEPAEKLTGLCRTCRNH